MEHQVGRLGSDALLVALGAAQFEANFESLLHNLSLDQFRIVEQLRRVRSRRTLSPTFSENILQLLDRAFHFPIFADGRPLSSLIRSSARRRASSPLRGTPLRRHRVDLGPLL